MASLLAQVVPQDADVFLEHSKSAVAAAIRWITNSFWNHGALVFNMTKARLLYCRLILGKDLPDEQWLGRACVIEAVGEGVAINLLADRVKESSIVLLARHRKLDADAREYVVNAALGFLGQRYGIRRLFAWLVDIVSRRSPKAGSWINLKLGLDVMICSLLVAYSYFVVRIRFSGRNYRLVSPDAIGDEVEANTEDWEIILKESVTAA